MLTMILIPAMLTALGIVREKEIGSIINLYASPAGAGAFLIGKQAPYVALAMVSYASLVALIVSVLGVPLKGSLLALTVGALLFVLASTGLGMMISTLVRTQVAAIFATALICLIPSVNFRACSIRSRRCSTAAIGSASSFPPHGFRSSVWAPSPRGLVRPASARPIWRWAFCPHRHHGLAADAWKAGGMKRWLINVWLLGVKELRSVLKDVTLMALIIFAFTVAIQLVATGLKAEVSNASVAIVDDDHSELSRRLRDAVRRPISSLRWISRARMFPPRWTRAVIFS
jgi:hypothetical protein